MDTSVSLLENDFTIPWRVDNVGLWVMWWQAQWALVFVVRVLCLRNPAETLATIGPLVLEVTPCAYGRLFVIIDYMIHRFI